MGGDGTSFLAVFAAHDDSATAKNTDPSRREILALDVSSFLHLRYESVVKFSVRAANSAQAQGRAVACRSSRPRQTQTATGGVEQYAEKGDYRKSLPRDVALSANAPKRVNGIGNTPVAAPGL